MNSHPGVLFTKVLLLKKHLTMLFSLLNMEKLLSLMNLCLSRISLGDTVKKNIFKSGAVKNNKGAGV